MAGARVADAAGTHLAARRPVGPRDARVADGAGPEADGLVAAAGAVAEAAVVARAAAAADQVLGAAARAHWGQHTKHVTSRGKLDFVAD